jgi:hypothetical protein
MLSFINYNLSTYGLCYKCVCTHCVMYNYSVKWDGYYLSRKLTAIATTIWLGDQGSIPCCDLDFFFANTPRLILGPTQSRVP